MKKSNDLRPRGDRLYMVLVYVALGVLALMILVPVAWVFLASFKQNVEFYGNPWTRRRG